MDNEQRLISNKISKPMLTKGRTYLETKESTNSIEVYNSLYIYYYLEYKYRG